MTRIRKPRTKFVLTLVATLAGGSMFTSCQTRLRDAVVAGSKDYLVTLLDPASFVEFLTADSED